MRKLKLFFAALALLVGGSNAVWAADEDYTNRIQNANLASTTGWTLQATGGNWSSIQGSSPSYVIEAYAGWDPLALTAYSMKQNVTLPSGKYRAEGYAFYRYGLHADTDPTKSYAKFVAGDFSAPVVTLGGETLDATLTAYPNNTGEASTAFTNGYYKSQVEFAIESESAIEFGYEGTHVLRQSWFIAGPIKLYRTGDFDYSLYQAQLEGLVNDAKALQGQPMKGDISDALDDVVDTYDGKTCSSVANYNAAYAVLNSAIADANTSIANYVEAKGILDAANTYDAAGQASYAANETIAAIQAAYDDNTLTAVTNEQKAAAQAALAIACKAQTQPAIGCDMSSWIVNPNFDVNADGWTIEKRGNGWTGNPYKDGTLEYWTGSTTDANASGNFFDFYQIIKSLPNGAYTIGAALHNDTNDEEGANWNGGGNAGVYGKTASNEVQKLVYENSGSFANYTTDEILVVDGELRIGVKNINPLTGRWFAADNFKLIYARQLTVLEATPYYDEAKAAAQNIITEELIPSSARSDLESIITSNYVSDGTANEYINAANNINEAITEAQALVAPYAAWKGLKPYADDLVSVSTNNAEENTTLASAINDQNDAVEAAMTAEAITTATTTLKEAMVTYATTAEPTNNECFDLTFMIVNPHFTEGEGGNKAATGWTLESGAITEHRLLTHNFEAYHTPFNLSQTIPDLQKGTYKVTLQGFARHDNNGPTDKTNLYCGIVDQKIKDINDEYSTTSLISGKPNMGDGNGESNTDGKYRPNGMSGSYYFFQEVNTLITPNQPFYTNEVQTIIDQPGDLKIGFKCETNTDWVIWDNFHLYYYGSAIAVTIDENAANSSYSADIENANVTLKRTIKGDNVTWNTIFLPFDLTDAETKAAFGDDAEIATYSEVADAGTSNSTVNFAIAEDAAIAANTPVLLRTSTAGTSYSFDGKTIKAGEAKVAGTNFDFVGTYAASTAIAEGDYFLSSNKLYRSKGTTTIKGTRAYIKAKATSEARIEKFFIDGIEATNIEGLTVAGATDGKIYNLNGQEVKAPKKGLYIQNGKKISIK